MMQDYSVLAPPYRKRKQGWPDIVSGKAAVAQADASGNIGRFLAIGCLA
jgi:hypothetical protein